MAASLSYLSDGEVWILAIVFSSPETWLSFWRGEGQIHGEESRGSNFLFVDWNSKAAEMF
jgi:hypothetical protein